MKLSWNVRQHNFFSPKKTFLLFVITKLCLHLKENYPVLFLAGIAFRIKHSCGVFFVRIFVHLLFFIDPLFYTSCSQPTTEASVKRGNTLVGSFEIGFNVKRMCCGHAITLNFYLEFVLKNINQILMLSPHTEDVCFYSVKTY